LDILGIAGNVLFSASSTLLKDALIHRDTIRAIREAMEA
jgi:hypothetical protein